MKNSYQNLSNKSQRTPELSMRDYLTFIFDPHLIRAMASSN